MNGGIHRPQSNNNMNTTNLRESQLIATQTVSSVGSGGFPVARLAPQPISPAYPGDAARPRLLASPWGKRGTWLLLAPLALATFGSAAKAAPGELDPTFRVGSALYPSAIALQSDGKLLVGGSFTKVEGRPIAGIARLNLDATLDTSFNPGSGTRGGLVRAIAIQADGKVVIAGGFTNLNGVACGRIARLNSDGSLDTSFNPGTGANDEVKALVIQPDGKVLVGGLFQQFAGADRKGLARINADGSLDSGYAPVAYPILAVYAVVRQPDGRVLVGGDGGIKRLLIGGSTDPDFPLVYCWSVRALALQLDGKVLIGGNFSDISGWSLNNLARLNGDGTLDEDFWPGTGPDNSVTCLAVQSDGKILLGGSFDTVDGESAGGLARLNPDGSLHWSVDWSGEGLVAEHPLLYRRLTSLAIRPNGRIILGGEFTRLGGRDREGLAQIHPGGAIDKEFNRAPGANGPIYALVGQPDGKLIIGGRFTEVEDTSRNGIARLNADGRLDLTFNPGSGVGATGAVHAVALQPDGRILIGGHFSNLNGVPRSHIARVLTNGSVDTTFNPGAGVQPTQDALLYPHVSSLVLLPDGKLILAGDFYGYDGNVAYNIVRVHPDGRRDEGFFGSVFPDVFCLTRMGDGRLAVGTWDTQPLRRLTPDGGLDPQFYPPALSTTIVFPYPDWSSVYAVATQSDGKTIIGGWFDRADGTNRPGVARLEQDGSLDHSFSPPVPSLGRLMTFALAVQPNGNVLVGALGQFSPGTPGGARSGIARLRPDGSLDTGFNPGGGAFSRPRYGVNGGLGSVRAIWQQPDGRVVVAGEFDDFNGLPVGGIVRLQGDPAPPRIETADGFFGFRANRFGFNITGTPGTQIVVESATNLTSWVGLRTNTLVTSPTYFSDPQSPTSPRRFYRLRQP